MLVQVVQGPTRLFITLHPNSQRSKIKACDLFLPSLVVNVYVRLLVRRARQSPSAGGSCGECPETVSAVPLVLVIR